MKQNKLKVAITGGIGSGKTTACEIIKQAGYPVFSCDKTYAKLFDSGYFNEKLVALFGKEILGIDGKPSRKKISEIAFCDEKKLQRLNEITHPAIFEKMFEDAQKVKSDVCFFEVPLLFEGGYQNLFDKVVVILREEEERIKSVMERDKISKEEIIARIERQYDYIINDIAQYYVIHNDGHLGEFCGKINDLLLKIAK